MKMYKQCTEISMIQYSLRLNCQFRRESYKQ
uniref:Uncharacterized protein n=1 Tax=Arundo donax TaxID=35708 RepID=A0A0A9QBJ6_ARUDO